MLPTGGGGDIGNKNVSNMTLQQPQAPVTHKQMHAAAAANQQAFAQHSLLQQQFDQQVATMQQQQQQQQFGFHAPGAGNTKGQFLTVPAQFAAMMVAQQQQAMGMAAAAASYQPAAGGSTAAGSSPENEGKKPTSAALGSLTAEEQAAAHQYLHNLGHNNSATAGGFGMTMGMNARQLMPGGGDVAAAGTAPYSGLPDESSVAGGGNSAPPPPPNFMVAASSVDASQQHHQQQRVIAIGPNGQPVAVIVSTGGGLASSGIVAPPWVIAAQQQQQQQAALPSVVAANGGYYVATSSAGNVMQQPSMHAYAQLQEPVPYYMANVNAVAAATAAAAPQQMFQLYDPQPIYSAAVAAAAVPIDAAGSVVPPVPAMIETTATAASTSLSQASETKLDDDDDDLKTMKKKKIRKRKSKLQYDGDIEDGHDNGDSGGEAVLREAKRRELSAQGQLMPPPPPMTAQQQQSPRAAAAFKSPATMTMTMPRQQLQMMPAHPRYAVSIPLWNQEEQPRPADEAAAAATSMSKAAQQAAIDNQVEEKHDTDHDISDHLSDLRRQRQSNENDVEDLRVSMNSRELQALAQYLATGDWNDDAFKLRHRQHAVVMRSSHLPRLHYYVREAYNQHNDSADDAALRREVDELKEELRACRQQIVDLKTENETSSSKMEQQQEQLEQVMLEYSRVQESALRSYMEASVQSLYRVVREQRQQQHQQPPPPPPPDHNDVQQQPQPPPETHHSVSSESCQLSGADRRSPAQEKE